MMPVESFYHQSDILTKDMIYIDVNLLFTSIVSVSLMCSLDTLSQVLQWAKTVMVII